MIKKLMNAKGFNCILLLVITAAIFSVSCGKGKKLQYVDLSRRIKTNPPAVIENNKLVVGIATIVSPKNTIKYYNELLNYFSEETGNQVEIVIGETYSGINEKLKDRIIDIAFVCSGAYIEAKKDFGAILLAAPVVNGKQYYRSYIIVNNGSDIKEFKNLKGRSFAFIDKLSNTGKLFPEYYIKSIGQNASAFFSSVTYTHSHDNSIKMVASNLMDGAAVDSLVWEYMNKTEPDVTGRTRIILKSDRFGMPPIISHPKINPEIRRQFTNFMTKLHKDKRGKQILDRIGIERFAPIDDSKYDSIRAMLEKEL